MAEEHAVRLLDTNTANQIAAGEVVEKPASVVKELVENALDAGADKIEVTIFAGGTEYIRVTDNGCGMSEADAKMAVLRHATSKLTKAEDLLSLNTLGFRGEALPSIASVSNFTLLTRPESEEFATSVHIDGGENMEVTASGGSTGTTVIVENLFFNVPARRKFLKTVSTEGRYISELLTRLALSRPDVRFKLVNNDKEVLSTPGDGDLEHAIKALYGKNVAENLLEVSLNDPKVRVSGFIGKPTLLKGTRQWQTFFVNGRCIGSKMLSKAMDHAYQSQIPKSGFPFAVINITVDTASVDVNVHPQKSEIKFSDDSLIYKAMYKALTDALTKPMSAQKTQVTLLPDSELNVFVKPQPQAVSVPVAPAPQVKPAYQPQQPVFKGGAEQIFKTPERREEPQSAAEPVFKSSAEPIFKTPERNEEQPAAEELLVNEQQPVPTVKKSRQSNRRCGNRLMISTKHLQPFPIPRAIRSLCWRCMRRAVNLPNRSRRRLHLRPIGKPLLLPIPTAVWIPSGRLVRLIKPLLLPKAKQRFILSTSMLPMSVFFMTSWWLRMSRFRRSSF